MSERTLEQHKEHLSNAELALSIWKDRVAPDEVCHALFPWKCDTQACFGGHLAQWPEFRSKGVYEAGNGGPCLRGLFSSDQVSAALFGNGYMFDVRSIHWTGEHEGTDHEVVVRRLETLIAAKQAIIANMALPHEGVVPQDRSEVPD